MCVAIQSHHLRAQVAFSFARLSSSHWYSIEKGISPSREIVGLSNILDGERREGVSGSKKRDAWNESCYDFGGQLAVTKVGKGIETVRIIETLLILMMTAFHLSVVAGSIGTDELVVIFQLSGRCLKEGF